MKPIHETAAEGARQAPTSAANAAGSRRRVVLLGALLAALCALAYSNSFTGRFTGLDARESIRDNPHIRRLLPLSEAMSLPLLASTKAADEGSKGGTVVRRPILSLSFALNYVLLGPGANGFHAVNLCIHIVAALLLFGIVRRTLLLKAMRERYGPAATAIAFAVASIWALHPVQTESVTYIVQRAESLMGMLFLLTFYCVVRSLDSPARRAWSVAAVAACAIAMGAKEVTAVLPVLVVAYDGVFAFDSYGRALRRRWPLYAALAATWSVIVVLILITLSDVRSDFTEGRNLSYALSQPGVLLHYLRLAVWPHPLHVYVNTELFAVRSVTETLVPLGAVAVLCVLTAWGILRRRPYGFVGAWFFLILAPTSTFVAVSDVIQEHRMYLSLAAPIALVVGGVFLLGRSIVERGVPAKPWNTAAAAVLACVLIACAAATHARNEDYHREFSMIHPEDLDEAFLILANHYTLGDAGLARGREEAEAFLADPEPDPDETAYARYLLGLIALEAESPAEAQELFEQVLQTHPDLALAHTNLGAALLEQGKIAAAGRLLTETVERWPRNAPALVSLGRVLISQGDLVAAQQRFEQALTIEADSATTYNNLAYVLEQRGDAVGAETAYRKAIALDPQMELPRNNLGDLLLGQGRIDEARAEFEAVLATRPGDVFAQSRLARIEEQTGTQAGLLRAAELFRAVLAAEPGHAPTHARLAAVLEKRGEHASAETEYERALELNPELGGARTALATLLARQARYDEALPHFERALQRDPENVGAHANLAALLASTGRFDDAAPHFEAVLRLAPASPLANFNLALSYEQQGDLESARLHYERETVLNPSFAAAHANLGRTLAALGRVEEAAAAYTRAVQLAPDDRQAARNLELLRAHSTDADLSAPRGDASLAEP